MSSVHGYQQRNPPFHDGFHKAVGNDKLIALSVGDEMGCLVAFQVRSRTYFEFPHSTISFSIYSSTIVRKAYQDLEEGRLPAILIVLADTYLTTYYLYKCNSNFSFALVQFLSTVTFKSIFRQKET